MRLQNAYSVSLQEYAPDNHKKIPQGINICCVLTLRTNHSTAGLWQLPGSVPKEQWPAFICADVAFGVEGVMTGAEERGLHYLRMVALVYNWWSLFVRLANPEKHHEAITSRPLLLHAVAKQTKHGGQTFLTITSHHAKSEKIEGALRKLSRFLTQVKVAAEQLSMSDRIMLIARHAFRKLIGSLDVNPVNLLCQSG